MYIAIDATAGEREREASLEPLLIQPIRRWQLVLGKWLATVVFGIIGATLTLLCMLTAMHQLPLESDLSSLRATTGPDREFLIIAAFT